MKTQNKALLRTSHKVRRPENADVRYNMKILLTIGITAMLLAGCKLEEQSLVINPESPLRVSRCAKVSVSNEVPDALQSDINTWMINNRDDWKSDINSYYPETVVENDYVRLNIQNTRVILSIKAGDNWPQYSRAAEPIHLKWKAEIEKLSEQSGPAYPPQGVGSADP